MNRIQRAVKDYLGDCSCAQSVLGAFGPELGLDRELALRLSAAFGSGMGHGYLCGAVTAAMMALGLKFGYDSEDECAETRAQRAVDVFLEQFAQQHGSLYCTELLGIDPGDPATVQRAIDEQYTSTRCPAFVQTAAEILECLLAPQRYN